MIAMTAVLGLGYPLVVLGVGQLALPAQANGSLVSADGRVVGSTLIGQSSTDAAGAPLPEWFQSRPSAAGYDAGASGGSNLGPENAELVASIQERRAAIAAVEGVDPAEVPADALTASASGLDPDISPEYALLQAARVALARGLAVEDVRALVESAVQPRELGYLGEETVNVLELNLALARL
jgi:K+-transporting ATPase ATPase C chain